MKYVPQNRCIYFISVGQPLYNSVCIQGLDEVERATINGSNVSRHPSQGVLVDTGAAIMQSTLYPQRFQSLQDWAQQDIP